MDSLALKYLGVNTIHFEDIAGTGKAQLTFNQIPVEQAGPYAAETLTLRCSCISAYGRSCRATKR